MAGRRGSAAVGKEKTVTKQCLVGYSRKITTAWLYYTILTGLYPAMKI